MRARLPWLFVVSAFAWGCEDGYEVTPYVPAEFQYACGGLSDAACDQALPALEPLSATLDAPPIALGARVSGWSPTPARLGQDSDGSLRALQPGIATLVAGGLTHVEVREVAAIRITHEAQAGSGEFFEIFGEDDFTLRFTDEFRAVPIDAEGNMLAGDLGCSWVSTNPEVIAVLSDPVANIVRFEIVGNGEATLRVEMGDLSAEVPFTIQGLP